MPIPFHPSSEFVLLANLIFMYCLYIYKTSQVYRERGVEPRGTGVNVVTLQAAHISAVVFSTDADCDVSLPRLVSIIESYRMPSQNTPDVSIVLHAEVGLFFQRGSVTNCSPIDFNLYNS